jgi:hypothetical protein
MKMPEQYLVGDAPKAMQKAARTYEERFNISFYTLTYFPKPLLDKLFCAEEGVNDIPASVTVTSRNNKSIIGEIEILTRIANALAISLDDRREYFATLKSIYSKLPLPPDFKCSDMKSLFVAPEREGRILADAMGWLPSEHSLHPHAKRIPYDGGLLVGLDKCETTSSYDNSVIVDGAIASGVTIMAVMCKLQNVVKTFHIYTVHSTCEGLRAIVRYGESLGLHINITVGHTTPGMNEKYYAILSSDSSKLMVGDLGDTIGDLEK